MVYTEKFFLSVDYSLGCTNYYMDYFKFEKKIAQDLCSPSVTRTFSFFEKKVTCRAWMTIMLNGKVGDTQYYVELLFITGMTTEQLDTILFATNLQNYLHYYVYTPVKKLYPSHCTRAIKHNRCTNKELVYLQWYNQTLLT